MATSDVDTVAVRVTLPSGNRSVAWFPLADGVEPWVGAMVALRAEDGRAVLAFDGCGKWWWALSGRVPAGTPTTMYHPGGMPQLDNPDGVMVD